MAQRAPSSLTDVLLEFPSEQELVGPGLPSLADESLQKLALVRASVDPFGAFPSETTPVTAVV